MKKILNKDDFDVIPAVPTIDKRSGF